MGDNTEMCLLQILKSWELSVEILSQVEDFLGYIQNGVFVHAALLDQLVDHDSIDEILSLKLLANLQSDIDCTNRKEWWVPGGQLGIVHGHFGEVDRHLLDQVVLNFRIGLVLSHHLVFLLLLGFCIRCEGRLFLFLGFSPALDFDAEYLQEIDLQKV